ncbi:winged helix-turn-helix domain-containing protein [Streptomyces sp. MNU76]|uniref:helix-turn-helix domain-containing protein n=1 Tax=Streptomyces sp. MNU76 TaxID=2560026 RepID=UPI0035A853EF
MPSSRATAVTVLPEESTSAIASRLNSSVYRFVYLLPTWCYFLWNLKIPVSRCPRSRGSFRELERGTLAHGWDEDQGWTLVRIRALIIRLFLVEYTVQGVWKLMRRHGWSAQVPARRALERDDASVERWRSEVWETVKPPRRPGTPTSASGTRPGRG